MLNGAMVWIVAIPLTLYLLGTGVGTLLNAASNIAAGPAVQNAAQQAANQNNANNGNVTGETGAANQNNGNVTGNVAPQTTNPTSQQTQNAVNTAGGAAWGTLLSLVLGFLAATLGGYVGSRPSLADRVHEAHAAPR